MKTEYYHKIRKSICIFFICICGFFVVSASTYAEDLKPQQSFEVSDGGNSMNGIGYEFIYTFNLLDYNPSEGTARYNVGQYFWITGKAGTVIMRDNLYIKNRNTDWEKQHIGHYGPVSKYYELGRHDRDEVWPATLCEGLNVIVAEGTFDADESGDAKKNIYIDKFNNPPTITGTDGTWMEGEVTSGKRTWESVYTDGATGTADGNRKQTSTGFMYYDAEEAPYGINTYGYNANNTKREPNVISNNSKITGIYNSSGTKVEWTALNNPGVYTVYTETTDSGDVTATGSRKITVIDDLNPTISTVNRSFYQGQYTASQWQNTLRWKDTTATDPEDGNLTSKITIKSDNVKVNDPGTYQVIYTVTDSIGQTSTATSTVTIKFNNEPTVTAPDREFYQDQYTKAYFTNTLRWQGVSAKDTEDGVYPQNKIKITSDNVNVSVPGTYYVKYEVTDAYGKKGTATSTVKVKYNNPPIVTAEDRWFFEDEDVTNARLLERAKATDIEDGNITSKIIITENTVKNHVIGDYKVTYKVTDAYGKSDSERVNVHIVKRVPTGDEVSTYLRFIDSANKNTLKPNSVWRTDLSSMLNNTLNIGNDDLSRSKYHWYLTTKDIGDIKTFNNTHDYSEESNKEFMQQFGDLLK